MTSWTLCVDFGTAYSKAAAAPADAWMRFDPALVRPLMLSGAQGTGNPFLLDSAVFVDEGRVLFGRAAIARADALAGKRRVALKSFKTLLSVSDLDRALNTNAPLSIDPHRVFQMRDLIVLYLAYLLEAVAQACAADPVVAGATHIDYRYAAPAWRSGDSAGMHDIIMRLFGEAEAFRGLAGKKLMSPDGVAINTIASALPKAMAQARSFDMGLIFEATAAAAYTSVGLEDSGSHMIVVDMGAGTTDIAALARVATRAVELPEARVTLKQAGDLIDRIIANKVIERAGGLRSREDQTDLWNVLMRQMRDIKEGLFADGRATLRHRGKSIALSMRDIERDADFKDFYKSLNEAFAHGLRVARGDAVMRGRSEVQAIAVGGGAAAPFIQDLLKKKMTRSTPRVVVRPATPEWAHAREFQGNLAPVFPQLAIAIGGALAPDGMLAARGAVSPAAAVQIDIEAARD
ncbi:MAG TPA: Hsp70 family protein [Vitreimonas sp.]|uniref:Hsp70 family protein n=1 Tax=Vitreimonas sp. TaxID=3069702 RepID=UPI002D2FBA4C|nr:Hsp70 family protein [Vitreimonas sp.]HYD88955.1 Hsp70 family protein [Vitreimonas sp.]